MRLIMQKLDFNKEYNKEELGKLLDELIAKNVISENEKEYIDVEKIIKFLNSDLYRDIKNAKLIKKEEPFYIYLDSDNVYETKEKEKILVQGIIDLYYINKDDELVLVDYKTDYVKELNELREKYQKQLDIYKNALERALNRKVQTVYIYSLYLGKEIQI